MSKNLPDLSKITEGIAYLGEAKGTYAVEVEGDWVLIKYQTSPLPKPLVLRIPRTDIAGIMHVLSGADELEQDLKEDME